MHQLSLQAKIAYNASPYQKDNIFQALESILTLFYLQMYLIFLPTKFAVRSTADR
jgi:hypothetical protein